MAHVSYIEHEDAEEQTRRVFDRLASRTGLVLNLFKALAHNPALLQAYLELDHALETMRLDPKLRELAYLAATELNGCDYDRAYHHAAARRAGLSERQVQDLDQHENSDAYDDLQRDVIRFAEQVTKNLRAEEALTARLNRSLSDQELVELSATVALANFTNRIARALNLELP